MPAQDEQRVRLERTKMLLHYPFWGELCISLGLHESKFSGMGAVTFSTDGDKLYFPPSPALDEWDDDSVLFALAHEVLHCGLGHLWRRGDRTMQGWQIAADLAVNSLLRKADFPIGGMKEKLLWPENFDLPDGLGAEEYYSMLPQDMQSDHVDFTFVLAEEGSGSGQGDSQGGGSGGDKQDDKQDGQGGGSGGDKQDDKQDGQGGGSGGDEDKQDGQGGGSGGDEDKQDGQGNGNKPNTAFGSLDKQAKWELWKARMVRAATVAKMMGNLPGGIQDLIDDLLYPKVGWNHILADAIPRQGIGYDWCKPNPRYDAVLEYMGEDTVLPDEIHTVPRIVVAVDTSGSIGKDELTAFLTEITAMAQEAQLTAIACDASIHAIEEFPAGFVPPMEDLNKLCVGRGGTNFCPVFEWVEKEIGSPDMLIYLTDGYGSFPDRVPFYPVWWLTTDAAPNHYPFGRVIEYEVDHGGQ